MLGVVLQGTEVTCTREGRSRIQLLVLVA